VISPAGKPENVDHPLYYVRDGIVIIPKNAVRHPERSLKFGWLTRGS